MASFKEAFKKARAEQGAGGTFTWNGKSYTTDYKEEAKSSKPKPKARPDNLVGKSPRPKARSDKPKVNSEAPSFGTNDTSGGPLKVSSTTKKATPKKASTGRKDYKYNRTESNKEQSKIGSRTNKTSSKKKS